jgi:hypothetical protein
LIEQFANRSLCAGETGPIGFNSSEDPDGFSETAIMFSRVQGDAADSLGMQNHLFLRAIGSGSANVPTHVHTENEFDRSTIKKCHL